ncbi:MAG: STM4012 family radical SAM protein [Bryobacterales bacterium]|nr:STM4012 family radical SAM protein [Bryobacterales bacterium]
MDRALRGVHAVTAYEGYAYSYPHKSAYRPLDEPVDLAALWARERREALFLYVHVPFCEMRCGFCNLFTAVNLDGDTHARYLAALERQWTQVRAALGSGDAKFARFAIGGGTPTVLGAVLLARLLALAPGSVETSPLTATAEKVALLRAAGVARVSIGVQSFVEEEARAAGRSQSNAVVRAALERIARAGFASFNIDLMYGLPGQTASSWLASLGEALTFAPTEVFLYPLYVRALTGLGRTGVTPEDALRRTCYDAGRAFLLAEGFEQISMRMFRRGGAPPAGPQYCCQTDGMVGLGCGARSYTRALHWSFEYAVSAAPVRSLIDEYSAAPDSAFTSARYGIALDGDEQRRRFVIQSLLQADGLDLAAYTARFRSEAMADLTALPQLIEAGWARREYGALRLTEEGLAQSDAIGPRLYSPAVRARMEGFALR